MNHSFAEEQAGCRPAPFWHMAYVVWRHGEMATDAGVACVLPHAGLQRKRAQRQFARENAAKSREEAKKYHDLVVKRKKEAKKAREEQASKRRSQNSATKSGASGTTKK